MESTQTAVEVNSISSSSPSSVVPRPPPSFTLSQLFSYVPRTPRTLQITPLGSPMVMNAVVSIPDSPEEVGNVTKLHSLEDWLPITESRNGNVYYAAFHTLNSGFGIQTLLLPISFTILGWSWGIICLSLAFTWQLYTLWLLIQMHEPLVPGKRCSRYIQLAKAAFGEKMGKLLVIFPLTYLSGGACVSMVLMGGRSMKLFVHIVTGSPTGESQPLTTIEWYLVFVCLAILIAQHPNLNSIAWISLMGAITAMSYCTLIWVISISKSRPMDVSYDPINASSDMDRAFTILNALGTIAFAFRGHNLVLEIQGTIPSSEESPSRVAMWRAVKFAYLLIAMCLSPLSIGCFWAYGNQMLAKEGLLNALHKFHGHDTSRLLLGLTTLLVVISYICSFQIYAMPSFDNLEYAYSSRKKKPCPSWLRFGFRAFLGCSIFFVAIAIPFLTSLVGLFGGIALPVTLSYPCFMWNLLNKTQRGTVIWYVNWVLGWLGIVLSVLVVIGAVGGIVVNGVNVRFFKP